LVGVVPTDLMDHAVADAHELAARDVEGAPLIGSSCSLDGDDEVLADGDVEQFGAEGAT